MDKLKVVTFTYDPFGRRLSKSVSHLSLRGEAKAISEEEDDDNDDDKVIPRTTSYVYDNEDIIMEYNHKGKVTARYVHGQGIDEPLAIERLAPERLNQGKGKVYYYHFDGLGSITALTDGKGKIAVRYEYDSFGKLKRFGNKVKNTFTYTAREYDRETGLYYYRARYYDAKVGRFISVDPSLKLSGNVKIPYLLPQQLQNPQELNLFTYVKNNSTTLIDPFGLSSQNPQQRYSCLSNCLQNLLSDKWDEFKCCCKKVGIAGVTIGTVTCATIVIFEPYLTPTFPTCAGLTSASTTAIGVGLCLARVEVGGLAGAAGCVVGCFGL